MRPEHVSLADAAALRGRVFGTEYLGTMQIVTIVTAYGQVKARLSSKITVQRGETVGLALQPDRLCVFDAATGRALQSALYSGAHRG